MKVTTGFLPILTGSDLSSRRLPRVTARAPKDGPVVWVTACIHGDEVGGMVVAQELIKYLKKHPLVKGTVHTIPLMNPIGFESGVRNVPVSGDSMHHENLNRAFPGDREGSVTERIAHTIFAAIIKTKPALVVDLHNDWSQSIPYALLDPARNALNRGVFTAAKNLAQATSFPVIHEGEASEPKYELVNSLSGSMAAHGIPSFTLELGPAYAVDEHFVELGVQALINVLVELEMLPAQQPFTYPTPKHYRKKTLCYTQEPRGSKSGIVRFIAKPGDEVKEGQPLARIYNSFGELEETVVATRDALVLGHADYSVAFPGMTLYAFAFTPNES